MHTGNRLSVVALLISLGLAAWQVLWPLAEMDAANARGAWYSWLGLLFVVALLVAPFLAVLSIAISLKSRPFQFRSVLVSLVALAASAAEGVVAVNSFH